MTFIKKLIGDKRGVGAIEYALIASLISVAAVAAFQGLGAKVETHYSNIDQGLGGAL